MQLTFQSQVLAGTPNYDTPAVRLWEELSGTGGFLFVLLGIVSPCREASFYPARLDDPSAVYLTRDRFSVRGDGIADYSAAIQAGIDRVQETTGEEILFIPEGRYRVTRTIYVWLGVRLIGYGKKRPVFVLADSTPGFQQGIGYMFFLAGGRHHRAPRRSALGGAAGNLRRSMRVSSLELGISIILYWASAVLILFCTVRALA